jgi:nucleoside-diphosphate-sugar epimerase
MRIAILGATSQIAKDLILSFIPHSSHKLVLFARRSDEVLLWLNNNAITDRCVAADFSLFNTDDNFDVIINFVGVGDPKQAVAIGAEIFEVTLKYDDIALGYVRHHPDCRYIFLSSGAVYGEKFHDPVNKNTLASVGINNFKPQHWYGVAKMHAECRHRSLSSLSIIDLRIFNYFSHRQNMEAGFLITDAFRAIRDQTVLVTSEEDIVRDYLHPSDFYQMVELLLQAPISNNSYDCYSLAPVRKFSLLEALKREFGLHYKVVGKHIGIQATGEKVNYFSLNRELEHIGYRPHWSSLEGVMDQGNKLLAQIRKN